MKKDIFSSRHDQARVIYTEKADGNMALHVGNETEKSLSCRGSIAENLSIPLDRWVFMHQVHGACVAVVGVDDAGKGARDESTSIGKTDAMITNVPGMVLAVMSADCVPVLFYDPMRGVIGVAHAGWRGTQKEIAPHVLDAMVETYGVQIQNVLVFMGPSIGPCCYEIPHREEICESVVISRDEKEFLDLARTNEQQLIKAGISRSNIKIINTCTSCLKDDFFSYRRDGGIMGEIITGIVLKKPK